MKDINRFNQLQKIFSVFNSFTAEYEDNNSEMFNLFYEKRHLVIGVGLILAIFDFLLAKFGKKHQDLAIKGHNH